MINFTNYVVVKRRSNAKALKAGNMTEAKIGDVMKRGEMYGWKSWEQHQVTEGNNEGKQQRWKKRSCTRDGNTRSVCIQYMQWMFVCILPHDPEGVIQVEKIYFDSEDTLFNSMTPKINRNQMKAWYRLVNCVWNFTSSEEITKSACGPLKGLIATLTDLYSFSHEEWKSLFLTKPMKCPHEDDLPMIDICTMLLSREDHQSLQALSSFWADSIEDLSHTAESQCQAVLTSSNITVGALQPWEFTRNMTNPLLSYCMENGPTVIAQVKDLLKDGFDTNLGNVHGWKPVHYAAFNGNAELMACLVVYGRGSINNLQDKERHQWSPLHIAADRNNVATVEFLVEWQKLSRYVGLKLQESNDFDVTNAAAVVEAYLTNDQQQRGFGYVLSDASASLLHRSWNNLLEVMHSKRYPARFLRKYLREYGGMMASPAAAATRPKHWPCIDAVDPQHRSPLLLTTSVDIQRYLLFHDADPLQKDKMFGSDALNNVAYGTSNANTGRSAEDEEARNERIRAALLLTAAFAASKGGRLLMQTDFQHRSSLMVAVDRKRPAMIELLIAATLMELTAKQPGHHHDHHHKTYAATIRPLDIGTRSFRFDCDTDTDHAEDTGTPSLLSSIPRESQYIHPSIDVTQTVKVTVIETATMAIVVPRTWLKDHMGQGVLFGGFPHRDDVSLFCRNRPSSCPILPVDSALIGPGLERFKVMNYATNERGEIILLIPTDSLASVSSASSSSPADEIPMPSLSTSSPTSSADGGSTSKSKEICRFFQQHGHCRFGEKCHYTHIYCPTGRKPTTPKPTTTTIERW